MSFLRVKSPVTPKMTNATGWRLSMGRFCWLSFIESLWLFFQVTNCMPPKLIAQGCQEFRRVALILPAAKSLKQRQGDHRCGHVIGDRLQDRPTPFTRVVHPI